MTLFAHSEAKTDGLLFFFFPSLQQATHGEIPEDELHLLLTEVDTNKNGLIELDEFLQVSQAKFSPADRCDVI